MRRLHALKAASQVCSNDNADYPRSAGQAGQVHSDELPASAAPLGSCRATTAARVAAVHDGALHGLQLVVKGGVHEVPCFVKDASLQVQVQVVLPSHTHPLQCHSEEAAGVAGNGGASAPHRTACRCRHDGGELRARCDCHLQDKAQASELPCD